MPKKLTRKQIAARKELELQRSQIILHALYLRWGLPTTLLKR